MDSVTELPFCGQSVRNGNEGGLTDQEFLTQLTSGSPLYNKAAMYWINQRSIDFDTGAGPALLGMLNLQKALDSDEFEKKKYARFYFDISKPPASLEHSAKTFPADSTSICLYVPFRYSRFLSLSLFDDPSPSPIQVLMGKLMLED